MFFLVAVFWAFRNLPKVYFQQDEWHFFGWMLSAREGGIINMIWQSLKVPRALASLTFQGLFSIFATNERLYNYFSLFFHGLNSFLVFYLTYRLTKKRLVAALSGLFFAFNSVHLQSILWIGASVGSLFSTFFSLLSIILFFDYLKERKFAKYIWAVIFLIISVFYKETSLFLFLFYPILDYIWFKNRLKKVLATHRFLLLGGLSWGILRFLPSLSGAEGPYISRTQGGNFFLKLISNLIIYPLQNLSLPFVAPQTLYKWANELLRAKFSQFAGNDLLIQTLASEYVSLLLSLAILLTVFFFYYAFKKEDWLRKSFVTSLTFIFFSTLPLLLLPKSTAYFESRNYYLLTIGSGILFGSFIWSVSKLASNLLKRNSSLIFIGVALALSLPHLYYQIKSANLEIEKQIQIGSVRKGILSQILNSYPEISDQTVFYTESDEFYLGPSATIMPFQSGFGHILLVKYVENGELSPEFLKKDYLWDIWSQGYKEVGVQGFGYFRESDKLTEILGSYGLEAENVYAFSWEEGSLYDITENVRTKINLRE